MCILGLGQPSFLSQKVLFSARFKIERGDTAQGRHFIAHQEQKRFAVGHGGTGSALTGIRTAMFLLRGVKPM